MKDITKVWLKIANKDYDTAFYLYNGARYPDFSQEMYSTKIKISPIFNKGKELYECLKKKFQMP